MTEGFKAATFSYAGALFESMLWFCFTAVQQGGFFRKPNIGIICFSFTHAVRAILSGNMAVQSSNKDIVYIPLLGILIVLCAVAVLAVKRTLITKKISPSKTLLYLDAGITGIGILAGILCTYLIPLKISPFLAIPDGFYQSHDAFDGWTYHFGAKTALVHTILKIGYLWATVVTAYPMATIALFVPTVILIAKRRTDERAFFPALLWFICLALLHLYALAGLPSDARYYSFPIIIVPLCIIYILYLYAENMQSKRLAMIPLFALYCVEMAMCAPNVKNFSPMWLWHRKTFNTNIRKGTWYAGETMFWGEELSYAGRIIQGQFNSQSIENEDITLIADYGKAWPGNPGFYLLRLHDATLTYDSHTYYVFNKFYLFRKDIPAFIKEIEPWARIQFKGETGAFIYRGDQLIGYEKCLEEYR